MFFALFFDVPSNCQQRIVCVEFVKILREERMRRDLSIYAVAAKCGLSQQSISYIEKILRIADAVGVDFTDVLKQARKAAAKAAKK